MCVGFIVAFMLGSLWLFSKFLIVLAFLAFVFIKLFFKKKFAKITDLEFSVLE